MIEVILRELFHVNNLFQQTYAKYCNLLTFRVICEYKPKKMFKSGQACPPLNIVNFGKNPDWLPSLRNAQKTTSAAPENFTAICRQAGCNTRIP